MTSVRRLVTRRLNWAGSQRLRLATVVLCLVGLVGGLRPVPLRAQDGVTPPQHLRELINQTRLGDGLAPLGHSTLLTQAAQRHADDLVMLGRVTHEGSDGSSAVQRIREARYQAWNDGLLVDEVIWAGLGTAEDALTWLYTNPEWAILTDPTYREVGVGYADDNGVHYFVLTLGSRPGVLPIFINDGNAVTDSPVVALRLTNEEAVPLGDASSIGRAIEIRISNTPDFEGLPWDRWEPLVPWALESEVPGDYAVYVEFRDGADRTAIAEDTIRLVAPGESPPTPTPYVNLPDQPASTAPATLQPASPPLAETPTSPPSTSAPQVSDTASPTDPDAEIPAGDLPVDGAGTFTPYPTWTPLPTMAPALAADRDTNWPLLLAVALQVAALLIGFLVFLRRH